MRDAWAVTALLLVSPTSGCERDAEPHAAGRAAIVEGTIDEGDEAVVAIIWRRTACDEVRAGVVCTGTLIAPRVILTAAHCLPDGGRSAMLEVFFGAEVQGAGVHRVVVASAAHPAYDGATKENDAALLLLDAAGPVAPVALPTGTIEAVSTGATLRAVGYGVTERAAGDDGRKRTGTLLLDTTGPGSFEALPGPSMTCIGDSGGPVFGTVRRTEQLLGITSLGDVTCRSRATNQRVDVVLDDFVRPFLDWASGAPDGWPPGAPALTDLAGFRCGGDEDCPAALACNDAACVLPALGGGTFGPACGADAPCDDGSACARVWPEGPDACLCFAGDAIIPPPPPDDDSGGCSAGGGGSAGGGAVAWLAALIALGARARRRPARER